MRLFWPKILFFYFSVQLLFGPAKLWAQNDLRFEQLTAEQGLSQNTVTGISRDADGFMWFGTLNGLNRYNGYDFKIYYRKAGDSTSLGADLVNTVFTDSAGDLWIGTFGGGLSLYQKNTDNFLTFKHRPGDPSSLPDNNVSVIFEDSRHQLWLSTSAGLAIFDREKKTFETVLNYAVSDKTDGRQAIFEDSRGEIWAGAYGNGLFRIDGKSRKVKKKYGAESGLKNLNVSSISEDANGQIWTGTFGGGLFLLDPKSDLFRHLSTENSGLPSDNIQCLLAGSKGQIWIGAETGGLILADQMTGEIINRPHDRNDKNSIGHDDIYCLYEDPLGNIWIGTYSGGISYLAREEGRFSVFNPSNSGLNNPAVLPMIELPDGKIWMGTDGGGINIFEPKTSGFDYFTVKNGLPGNIVISLLRDSRERIWIGTYNEGLAVFEPKTKKLTKFRHKPSEPGSIGSNIIWGIYEDRAGTVWIATDGGGLNRFEEKTQTFKRFRYEENKDNCLSNNSVRGMYEDRAGNFWIGTFGGLNRMDREKETFEVFAHDAENPQTVGHNIVLSVFEDSRGDFWVSTYGGGLNRMNRKTGVFERFTVREGLAGNIVFGVLEDATGALWAGTNRGISKFDPQKKSFRNYSPENGLQSWEFSQNGFLETKNGEMYFAGTNGFNVFRPENIRDNPNVPPVFVTDFLIFNKSVHFSDSLSVLSRPAEYTSEIRLSYLQSVFGFKFSALNYTFPHKNLYACKLEGFDKEWVILGNKREIGYTNLPGGTYFLKIKAANNDGVWNENEKTIKIVIVPPFWETPLFIFACILAGILLIISIYLYRVRQMRLQNKKLAELVEIRTAELQKSNAELEEQKKEVLVQNEELEQQAEEISSQSETILTQNNVLKTANQKVQSLNEIARQIIANLDPAIIVSTTYHYIRELFAAEAFGIGIYNPLTKSIDFNDFMEKGERLPMHSDPLSDTDRLSVICFRGQKELIMNDFPREILSLVPSGRYNPQHGDLPESVIYLPLTTNRAQIGVMTAQSFKKNAYGESEILLLKSLASFISIALDNSTAYKTVEQTNYNMTAGIRYAQTIQRAILPAKKILQKIFPDHFLMYKPKDIVSGDFYWTKKQASGRILVVVADCTGHGVPGAFMSLVGYNMLEMNIQNKPEIGLSDFTELLDRHLDMILRQGKDKNTDSMDMCLCALEPAENDEQKVTFCGAKRPLYYYRRETGELLTLAGTSRSVGGTLRAKHKPFWAETLLLRTGDRLYLTTDGYADQYEPENQKLGTARFLECLKVSMHENLAGQKAMLRQVFETNHQNREQRDDITVLGIEL